MKKKLERAIDGTFIIFVICFTLTTLMSVASIIYGELAFGIIMGIISLSCLIGIIVLKPYCYIFDDEGLSICYVFFPVERYLWKNIHSIEVTYEKDSLLLLPEVFQINGRIEGKQRFFMDGKVCKTLHTKKLLEKYWDGTITGYFGEETKAWVKKHISKKVSEKEQEIQLHLTDEIVPMERETRAKARDIIKKSGACAKQLSLEIRTQYFYVTNGFNELRSRPKESYTYTVSLEISRPGETDENHILCIDIDLLYVRLTKTAYKGFVNENALNELQKKLTETLNNIREKGFDILIKETDKV